MTRSPLANDVPAPVMMLSAPPRSPLSLLRPALRRMLGALPEPEVPAAMLNEPAVPLAVPTVMATEPPTFPFPVLSSRLPEVPTLLDAPDANVNAPVDSGALPVKMDSAPLAVPLPVTGPVAIVTGPEAPQFVVPLLSTMAPDAPLLLASPVTNVRAPDAVAPPPDTSITLPPDALVDVVLPATSVMSGPAFLLRPTAMEMEPAEPHSAAPVCRSK